MKPTSISSICNNFRCVNEGKAHPGVCTIAPECKENLKPTNPKDAIGSDKLPLGLVPSSLIAFTSLAFLEGASKYGRYNWRIAGVRASIYNDALARHMAAWWNGEDIDPQTGVPHLANAAACIAILIDAGESKALNDDRPPRQPTGAMIRWLAVKVPEIKALFKDHNPKQYTILDSKED